jgi:hypothetical protein
MSTHSAHKGYELHRAVVQSADTVTGVTQVKIPDLLGNRLVDVHWAGLEKVGDVYKTPSPGDMSLVAVSNDGTQIMWVLSADHSALWNGIDTAQVAIADLQADLALAEADIDALTSSLAVVAAGVVQNSDDIAAIQSAMISTIIGTAFEVDVVRTGASVTLSFPTNVVKSGTGYFRVTNTGVSATAASVSRLEMGVVSDAPRIVFENSGSSTVWVVDNFSGTLRLFNGGAEKYNFTNSALTTTGSIGVVAGGTVQGTRLISTVSTGTAPLSVTSTTAVTNLNADLLDGNHAAAFALAATTGTTAPTLTNVTLGTGGTHTADWTYHEGVLNLQGKITLGSSGFSVGDARITLPNSYVIKANSYRQYMPVGQALLWDNSGPDLRMGFFLAESNSVMRLRYQYTNTSDAGSATDHLLFNAVSSTTPWTWAASDAISYNITIMVE